MSKKIPYNVMMPSAKANDWDKQPRDPVSAFIATAVTGAAAGTTLMTAIAAANFAWVAVYAVSTIAISAVMGAVSAKLFAPDIGAASVNNSSGLLVNGKGPLVEQEFIYGTVRKGGSLPFIETTGENNKFLHQVIVLAGHEIDEVEAIYVEDREVTLDSAGYVTSEPYVGTKTDTIANTTTDGEGRTITTYTKVTSTVNYLRVLVHDGSQTSATSAFANAPSYNLANTLHADTSAPSTFIGEGIAYLYVWMKYNQDVFVNGVPTITARIRGKKVKATSSGVEQTPAYSANAAWCIRDYLTSEYGAGVPAEDLDDDSFEAAAVICAQNIDGTSIDQYEIDGIVKANQQHASVIADMLTACNGLLFWCSGKWKLVVGNYVAPVKTLTLDDLRGSMNLSTKTPMRDSFHSVQGVFVDEDNDYISADYPAVTQDAFVEEDTPAGSTAPELKPLDLPLGFTTNSTRAQMIAKRVLFRSREQITFSAEFGMNAFDIEVGDVIKFRNEHFGWGEGSEKEFEVQEWALSADKESGDLRVNLTLRETSEAAFGFSGADAQTIISNNTSLLRFYEVPSIGIQVSQEYREVNENVVNVLVVNVTSSDIDRIDSVIVEYAKSSVLQYTSIGKSALVVNNDNVARFEIVGIDVPQINQPAIDYEIRVTALNSFGYRGTPVETTFSATADSTPPAAPATLEYTLSGGSIFFNWSAVADLDLSHYKLYYSTNTNASYGDASVLAKIEKIARPATTVSYPAVAGKFFIAAVDKTGNESTTAPSAVITSSQLPALGFSQTDEEHLDATPFSGTLLSNISRNGASIQMTSYSTAGSTGEYLFYHDGDGYFDVGTSRTVRLSYNVTVERKHANAVNGQVTWDDIPGNWDTWPDEWDTWTNENADFADFSVEVFARASDTTGGLASATWQGASGEVVGRYIQFKAILSNSNANVTPKITELTAIVEY